MSSDPHEHDVADAEGLRPGESLTFTLDCNGRRIEAFVINFRMQVHAYVNRCRHVPITLDWVENQFFSEDGNYLVCANHGAYYEPSTGECVEGPPCGLSLYRLSSRVANGRVLVRCPRELPP